MSEQQPAGWYPDPTDRSRQRYWDGHAWRDQAAPTQVQPTRSSSGATRQQQTRAMIQRSRHRRPKPLWVLGAMVLVLVVGGGAWLVLRGSGTSKTKSTAVSPNPTLSAKALNAEQQAHAISKAQFDSVSLGTSEGGVVKALGKPPQNPEQYVNNGVLKQTDIRSSCLYYNQSGASFGSGFRFCFTNTGLVNKKAF
jgi:hypothetical protein